MLPGLRSLGRAESARIAPPIGSVAPPVNETTPLSPIRIPGVAIPCRASSAAITEKAVPIRTVRPSFRLAPIRVNATAAAVAAAAVIPTPTKWTSPPNATLSRAKKCPAAVGNTANAPPTARIGASRSLVLRRMRNE